MGIIFHIDVNSAYLSWTAVKLLKEAAKDEKKIDIRNIPAIIGGDREKRHGIVLAKSISAKKFGIVTGEPIANALQKCPNILIVPPEHGYYNEQSHKLMNLLRTFTPDIEQVSVDECYMDFSGIQNEYPSPLACAYKIKDTVKEKLGFTVNVGISDVKVLAKMASDFLIFSLKSIGLILNKLLLLFLINVPLPLCSKQRFLLWKLLPSQDSMTCSRHFLPEQSPLFHAQL